MEGNPLGNMRLCFENTLAATFCTSVNNFIYLATCSSSGQADSMSVASLAERVAQGMSSRAIVTTHEQPNLIKMLYKIDLQLLESISVDSPPVSGRLVSERFVQNPLHP